MGFGPFDKRPGAIPLLRRAGSAPTNAAWGDPAGLTRKDVLQAQPADPGAEIGVSVTEPLAEAKSQLTEPDLPRVVAESFPSGIGDAVLAAVDDKAVQVLTAPTEHRLQDRVQLGDRGVGGHQQPPSDQRADSGDHHPPRVDLPTGTDPTLRIVSHHPILARYRGVGEGVGAGRRRYWYSVWRLIPDSLARLVFGSPAATGACWAPRRYCTLTPPGCAVGALAYAHLACTEYLTVPHAGDRSAAKIDADAVLPVFTGPLVRDGYDGYAGLPAAHPWCAAHLLRDLRSDSDTDPNAQLWATAMATTSTEANHTAEATREGGTHQLDDDETQTSRAKSATTTSAR